jgi:hypothetical protein
LNIKRLEKLPAEWEKSGDFQGLDSNDYDSMLIRGIRIAQKIQKENITNFQED